MTTFPVVDGARMLGIHPKTLHHWLKQAHLPLTAHPTDARICCVTEEQIQQLAKLHPRALVPPVASHAHPPRSQAESLPTTQGLLPFSPQEADLIQRLSGLETRVATLQEHLAQLALALLAERERAIEHRLSALESLTQPLLGKPMPDPPAPETRHVPACPPQGTRALNPAEQLARSRMPPLIQYSAQGTYVIINGQEGELYLVPDSPEWFAWLASLTSFRFVGAQGRFTSCRERRHQTPTRSWTAHRCHHGRHYKQYLGVTDRLTIASFEQAAAKLHAIVSSL